MLPTAEVRLIARLWWTATRRRWREETALLPVVIAFFVFLGFFVLSAPEPTNPTYVTVLLAFALPLALVVPIALRGEGVLASRRFALLPYTPASLHLLRLVFDNPLRLALAATLAGWGAVAVARLDLSPTRTAPEVIQLSGWILTGVLLAQLVEDALQRWNSTLAYEVAIMGGLSFSALLWPSLRALRGGAAGEAPESFAALRIGGQASGGAEWGVAAGAWGTVGLLLLLGRWLAARRARPPAVERPAPRLGGPIARVAARLAPRAPARFGKELALVTRLAVLRTALVFLLLFTAAALLAGIPPILFGIGLVWLGFSANLLGPDLPFGGITRYRVAAYPPAKVLVLRHAAILLVSFVAVALVGLVLVLVGLVRPPEVGGSSALAYPLAALYGASLFLLLTLAGDRFSLRFPDPVGLRSAMPLRQGEGGAWAGILLFLAWAVTAALAAGIFLFWMMALAAIFPAGGDEARLLAALPLATASHGLCYLWGIRRHLRAGT